jgi:hypothetical protein
MFRWEDRIDADPGQGEALELVRPGRREDGDVALPPQQATSEPQRAVLDHLEPDLGMLEHPLRQERCEVTARRRGGGPDDERLPPCAQDGGPDLVRRRTDPLASGAERLAVPGRAHASRVALQEPDPEILLESLDPAGHGWLRDPECDCSRAEPTMVDDRHEGVEVLLFHRDPVIRPLRFARGVSVRARMLYAAHIAIGRRTDRR